VRHWKTSERGERGGKKSRRKVCGKKKETDYFFRSLPLIIRKERWWNKEMEEEMTPLLTEQITSIFTVVTAKLTSTEAYTDVPLHCLKYTSNCIEKHFK
jgi:hypothetical protein